jgi:twitching motility protein PilT
MIELKKLLSLMSDKDAEMLYLSERKPPALKIGGQLNREDHRPIVPGELSEILLQIMTKEKIDEFDKAGAVLFGHEEKSLRYRVCAYKHRSGVASTFKRIPCEIKTAEELGLPPVIPKLAQLPSGLVIVSGPSGSGKSSTLNALIEEANRTRRAHIITIEDPIEYIHENKNCIIDQQELGTHTDSFALALQDASGQGADIILVSELRDPETIERALDAANNDQLVLTTVPCAPAALILDRMIESFPKDMRSLMRSKLADAIRAVVYQVLFQRIDTKGQCAAFEILIASPAVRSLIREHKTYALNTVISTGKKYGMQLFDDAVMNLLNDGLIDTEDAFLKAHDKYKFSRFLKNPPSDVTSV